ncbi:helix-turn-helix transcriptional regulator [Kordiimonas sp. SCSIO 12603]|uniref:ArsR/SmtB family transcription factor n=1 Tax=Kordiimonas sp. SCSIO 12603 TaxID=2829596 RepID=UPI002102D6AF|nr:metalloregulator ArsR/SmtB family transcription factor [Kordiimonas sp. SCSIO 12603]
MVDYLENIHILNHMVNDNTQRLDAVFHALSDQTRRGMLVSLSKEDQTVSDLAAPYAMSLAAASKHIKKLEQAGLVTREVIGRTHICRLNAKAMAEAQAWIKQYECFWADRLDDLETELLKAKRKQLAKDET